MANQGPQPAASITFRQKVGGINVNGAISRPMAARGTAGEAPD
jgi:hypothetical protein